VLAGAEQLLIGFARLADPAQWDLAFCTLTERNDLHRALDEYPWPAYALAMTGYTSVPSGVHRLRRLLDEFRPDIVHTHLSHAALLAAIVATVDRRLRVVQTRHYSDYVARFRKRRHTADAWAARRSKRVIAVSEAAKLQLIQNERVPPTRVTVVENGVEWDRLAALDHADGRRRLTDLGVPPGAAIGCAASFNVRKGHTHLLHAMVRVRARHPHARLVLLGTGADEALTPAEVERPSDIARMARSSWLGSTSTCSHRWRRGSV
jgi:glycosyltransferase involved in cell wall biosynthesis